MTITKEAALEALELVDGCLPTWPTEQPEDRAVATLRLFIEQSEAGDRDAARMDWLERVAATPTIYIDGTRPWSFANFNCHKLKGPTLRAAIDAAIQSSKVGESQ